ncbi:MAG: hypothetical protein EBZ12_05320 [Alphaproteobacteria bacterium]|nr:hypothetical protein [Alphaproteobacteria bacterium]
MFLSTDDVENISCKYTISVLTRPLENALILIDGNVYRKLNINEVFARTNSNGDLILNRTLAGGENIAITDF